MPPKKQTKRTKRASAAAAAPAIQPRRVNAANPRRAEKASAKKESAPSSAVRTKVADGGRERRFPIVGIGASAGGLEALEELFAHMPNDTGMAFVVITHQHPEHTSLLPELLGRVTHLKVLAATDGLKVEPNHVYVIPPGGDLAILNGTLHWMETKVKEVPHLPINYFFRSLAEDQKEKAIGIILSGTGTDGTLGLRAIKGEGGMAMAQDVQSAKFAGMPESALATGLVDCELPAGEMPKRLVAYARGPYLAAAHIKEPPDVLTAPLQKIFVLLRSRTGNDFSWYKSNTIHRRIERRMNLHQIKGRAQYVRYLQENPSEIDNLFKDLLISVTSFFRDPEAFEVLAKSVLPAWLKSLPDEYTLRIWVPGCATGEEVFSIAILIREGMEAANRRSHVQIFGTDLDGDAIEAARLGQYPDSIAADVSAGRLERYFVGENGRYRVRKDIREMAIFAVQNVIKDPPFTRLDIISCRNLLIYLNADLQRRLLPIFHYALKPGGLLFLGSSETVGGLTDLFEVVDKKWKIFRRKETALAMHPLLELPARSAVRDVKIRGTSAHRPHRELGIAAIVDRLLLARFVPASVVVNDRGDVVYIHGRTGAYLEPAAGQPRHNLLEMAREGLRLELASALREAAAQDAAVTREGVPVRTNGGFAYVNLSVAKIREPESVRGLLLVAFQSRPPSIETGRPKGQLPGKRETGLIERLERELQCTKETLQTTIEELEASNEDLKSANEELQSTNEEFQSTNEEMETSREEMQSLNEELTTVNAEVQAKVEELSRANDDLQNLLNSTDVATIFLDRELKIKRYTKKAPELVNVIQTDIGRPLWDLASSLAYEHLVADCREVLRTLVCKVAEVRTKGGHWYLMRIMPYRTADNVIDGAVVTFVDINAVKVAEKSLLRMSKVFLEGPEPMVLLDLSGRIIGLNDEAVRAYGWTRHNMLRRPFQVTVTKAGKKIADGGLRRCLSGEAVRNVECAIVTKAGRELRGSFTLKLLTDDGGEPDAICMLVKHSVP
ncbi:MAG: chemotaxis protein CheB [Chthoniobacter sp.]|nr:chemotaxis protein CheB [Chthoniobacter sp.]